MSEANPRGSLSKNGNPYSMSQLAALARAPTKEVEKLVAELEREGVFSREEDGTIFSRRMRRDIEKEEENRANGKRGGNPQLKRQDNGRVNPLDKVGNKAQKPEARSQKPDPFIPDRSRSVEVRVGVVKAFEKANVPTTPDTSRVEVWLAQGYSPELILAVVADVLATNRGVRSLSYFDAALERARQKAVPAGEQRPEETEPRFDFGNGYSAPYGTIRAMWAKRNWLTEWGPRPGEPGCRIKPDVIGEIMGERVDA